MMKDEIRSGCVPSASGWTKLLAFVGAGVFGGVLGAFSASTSTRVSASERPPEPAQRRGHAVWRVASGAETAGELSREGGEPRIARGGSSDELAEIEVE
jgi:hypothetical protein